MAFFQGARGPQTLPTAAEQAAQIAIGGNMQQRNTLIGANTVAGGNLGAGLGSAASAAGQKLFGVDSFFGVNTKPGQEIALNRQSYEDGKKRLVQQYMNEGSFMDQAEAEQRASEVLNAQYKEAFTKQSASGALTDKLEQDTRITKQKADALDKKGPEGRTNAERTIAAVLEKLESDITTPGKERETKLHLENLRNMGNIFSDRVEVRGQEQKKYMKMLEVYAKGTPEYELALEGLRTLKSFDAMHTKYSRDREDAMLIFAQSIGGGGKAKPKGEPKKSKSTEQALIDLHGGTTTPAPAPAPSPIAGPEAVAPAPAPLPMQTAPPPVVPGGLPALEQGIPIGGPAPAAPVQPDAADASGLPESGPGGILQTVAKMMKDAVGKKLEHQAQTFPTYREREEPGGLKRGEILNIFLELGYSFLDAQDLVEEIWGSTRPRMFTQMNLEELGAALRALGRKMVSATDQGEGPRKE